MNNFGDLPAGILLSIANNISINDLYTCTLINKQLHAVVNPILWRAPNVRNSASLFKVTTSLFLATHPVSQHIRKLDLGMGIDNVTLLLLLKQTTGLEELNIRHGELITDESFQHIPEHCRQLKSLHLHDVSITQHSLNALGQHCSQLQALTLSHCLNLSPSSLLALVDLRTLTLISPAYTQDLALAREWVKTLSRLQHLTCLSIGLVSIHFIDCLLTISWPALTYLRLEKCSGVDDQHLISFLKLHPHINRLYLCESSITDDTLQAISSSLIEIGIDDNPQITTHAIRQLIWDNPLLSHVACRGCAKTEMDFPEADKEEYDGGDILYLGVHTINKIRHGVS